MRYQWQNLKHDWDFLDRDPPDCLYLNRPSSLPIGGQVPSHSIGLWTLNGPVECISKDDSPRNRDTNHINNGRGSNLRKHEERNHYHKNHHQADSMDFFFSFSSTYAVGEDWKERVKRLETCQLTDEIWVIRSQLVMKLICMRLVNWFPKGHALRHDWCNIIRICGPSLPSRRLGGAVGVRHTKIRQTQGVIHA